MLSVRQINIFNDNERLISNIKKDMFEFVTEYGIEDAINGTDFSKIKKICPDFGDQFARFINEEKMDFIGFLYATRKKANQGK